MKTVALGRVVDVTAGQAAPPASAFSKEGTPFIRAGSLERLLAGNGWDRLERLDERAASLHGMKLFPPDTVIFAKSGMSAAIGRIFRLDRPAYVVSHLAALRPTGKYEPTFLAHWLNYYGTSRLIKDAAYPSIRLSDISNVSAPNLSLPDQRRIATILDQADELCRKRHETRTRSEQIRVSIYQHLFHDGNGQSRKWPTEALGSLCTLVRGSSPRPQGDPRFFGGPVPRLMIADITRDGKIVTPTIDTLTEEGARKSRPMPAGSVVMAVSGAVGLPAILAVDACIHDGFVGLRGLDRRIETEFLYYYLRGMRSTNSALGTGAIWVNLTTDQVKRIAVPLPPPALQQEFTARMKDVDQLADTIGSGVIKLDQLRASLHHRAFHGEL